MITPFLSVRTRFLAALSLIAIAACGERFSLGGGEGGQGAEGAQGGGGLQPGTGAGPPIGGMGVSGGSIGEPCFGLSCGEPCPSPLDECNDEPCPEPGPWFCSAQGFCEPGPPSCEDCINAPCGVPCAFCEPAGGPCFEGACGGFGSCEPAVECVEESMCKLFALDCGELCDPCAGWFPVESCPYVDQPAPLFVCDALGLCTDVAPPACP